MWYALLFILLGAAPVDAANRTSRGQQPAQRTYKQISDEIHEVFRAEATAKDPRQRAAAVQRMAALYREILRDPRLQTSDTLKGYKAKLWSRLTRIKNELQRKLKRRRRSAMRGKTEQELHAIEQATRSLAEHVSLMNYTMGGPSYVFQHAGGSFGGRTQYDYGQDLVDLIENTIKPDFWDVRGGPGTIFYYRPLMALVVRATSEIHGNVAGLLGAMRQAGP